MSAMDENEILDKLQNMPVEKIMEGQKNFSVGGVFLILECFGFIWHPFQYYMTIFDTVDESFLKKKRNRKRKKIAIQKVNKRWCNNGKR